MLLKSPARIFTAGLLICGTFLLLFLIWAGPQLTRVYPGSTQLTYHQRLATVRPWEGFTHDSHLGVFSRIYVIGLPQRSDRKARMAELSSALDIDVEFWDATDKDDALISTLMERRRQRIALEEEQRENQPTVGSTRKSKAIWPTDVLMHQLDPVAAPLGTRFAELWELPASDPRSTAATDPLPEPPVQDDRPALPCADGDNPVPLSLDIANLPAWRILSRGMVACWYSHVTALRRIAEKEEFALILEDDVDIEWDIEARLRMVWGALPVDWDIVYLGHCWSEEATYPPITTGSALHRSFRPKCNHAYAVSPRGAYRLIRHLRAPAFAYSRALDQAFLYLVQHNRIKAFSFYPSIIVQTKETASDIFPGNGSSWKERLSDSTLERIQLLKELEGA